MSQPNPAQPDESQQIACAEEALVDKLSSEQLRRWLGDRRKSLRDARWNLLAEAKKLDKEIIAINELLAELTTD